MSIFKKTHAFQSEVIGMVPPTAPIDAIDHEWTQRTTTLLAEELDELCDAASVGDRAECVDALIDIIYVASGALNQMGVDGDAAFDLVHHANMCKIGGVKPSRGMANDAMKPDGWTPPDHTCWFEL